MSDNYTIKAKQQTINKESKTMETINLGNNESVSRGVFKNSNGTFTAMTFTKSQTFKTERGATAWLKRNTQE